MVVDTSLYDVLSVPPDATPAEIKAAYRRASLASHPDKNPNDETAHARFQEVGAAYEVLSDPDRRHAYDTFGPEGAAAGSGAPGGMEPDLDDVFAQMFGMGGAGGGGGGMPRRRRHRQRGEDSVIRYSVTLPDLYNGRTAHFHLQRDVLCPSCSGSGGRPGMRPARCLRCGGEGRTRVLRNLGNGMVSQSFVGCGDCDGRGEKIREKERCKKCKGAKVVKAKTRLELVIERGMRDGERIVFKGENDQEPDVPEPGDIIFELALQPDPTFTLRGLDLLCTCSVTLSESLLGFDRHVLTHLDGRSLRVRRAGRRRVTRPGEVERVAGEGMMRRGDRGARGDLYIRWEVEFPEDGWLSDIDSLKLAALLPPKKVDLPPPEGAEVDEVSPQPAELDEFGRNAAPEEERAGGGADGWDHDQGLGGGGGPQCAAQ